MTDSHDSRSLRGGLPLLSIVIPVWNVEKYLKACLDSITDQPFREVEIIAVEGASTDSSGALLDKLASLEPRLTVIHLDPLPGLDRVGPGRARNAGLACAKGDYIWFVDGDDAIAAGCLSIISARLARDNPDVLFIGNELILAGGKRERTRPGRDQHLLLPEAARFTLAERPAVAELSMASWNKIVRREFLLSTDKLFLDVWPHEDIPVSCAMLVEARNLAILSSVCYRYRQDRRGSAMLTSGSSGHFNVFHAWRSVLAAARSRRDAGDPTLTPEIYAVLFQRSIWHLTNIFDKGSLGIHLAAARRYVRSGNRRKFFVQMHAHYGEFKPAGFRKPPEFRGVKFTLVEDDAYFRYLLLAQLNGVRVWLGRARRRRAPAITISASRPRH